MNTHILAFSKALFALKQILDELFATYESFSSCTVFRRDKTFKTGKVSVKDGTGLGRLQPRLPRLILLL